MDFECREELNGPLSSDVRFESDGDLGCESGGGRSAESSLECCLNNLLLEVEM